MEKRQVLLLSIQPLLGEGLRRIFQNLEEVDLVCLECWDLTTVEACVQDLSPMMIVLAAEKEDDRSTHLIAYFLKHYEDIPVMWVDLETAMIRVYMAHSMTANSSELIHAILAQDTQSMDVQITEKSFHPTTEWRKQV